MANSEIKITVERRPCFAKGKRAMFHRWADAARPVVPRGMEETETQERYQHYTVRAIVEYEDGTINRVWPSDIVFVDGGGFEDYAWPAYPPVAAAPDVEKTRDCYTCKHGTENADQCAAVGYVCRNCQADLCPCKNCRDGSNWQRRVDNEKD